jgi:hypothetical protein
LVKFLLIGFLTVVGIFSFTEPSPSAPKQESGSSSLEKFPWRKRGAGWQDRWQRPFPDKVRFERSVELIHPLVVASLIVLASLAARFWSAEEWEFTRLVQGDQHVCRRSLPRYPSIADYGETNSVK